MPRLTDPAKYYVVDIRERTAYSAGHIPNSVEHRPPRPASKRGWGSWSRGTPSWCCAGEEKDLREALFRLHRVGYNRPTIRSLRHVDQVESGGSADQCRSEMIPPQKLYAQMQSEESPLVLDVRLPSEWMGLRIGTVINIPLSELVAAGRQAGPNQPVVAVCNSAYRSNMAVGILERAGFTKPASLAGGSEAWIEAGLPVYRGPGGRHGRRTPSGEIRLAERMSAAELKRLLHGPAGHVSTGRHPARKQQFADYQPAGLGERRHRRIARATRPT